MRPYLIRQTGMQNIWTWTEENPHAIHEVPLYSTNNCSGVVWCGVSAWQIICLFPQQAVNSDSSMSQILNTFLNQSTTEER
jgi:hypothetical protein